LSLEVASNVAWKGLGDTYDGMAEIENFKKITVTTSLPSASAKQEAIASI